MKRIAILIPKGEIVISSVVGAFKLFNAANTYLQEIEGRKSLFFDVKLVGVQKETHLYDGLFNIKPNVLIKDFQGADLVIIPAIRGSSLEKGIEQNKELIQWIKKQYNEQPFEIASLCTGAFLLASTGLLKGKECTTHWMAESNFRKMFPQVIFLPHKIITDDQGIYTSGGAYSAFNLILYLLEKFGGKALSIWASKVFQIDIYRDTQSHFTIFKNQKTHQDFEVIKVQEFIETNYKESLSVTALAKKFTFSRRNFIRRFKTATGNTPNEYIQRVRVEAAKQLLESTNKNIGEVMLAIGYHDSKTFRNIFKRFTGFPPKIYRDKYTRA